MTLNKNLIWLAVGFVFISIYVEFLFIGANPITATWGTPLVAAYVIVSLIRDFGPIVLIGYVIYLLLRRRK